MKTFKTVRGCVNHILKNKETGKEKTINDSLHYGMGLYVYSSDFNICFNKQKNKNLFVHLDDQELYSFVEFLLLKEGYLYSM